MTVNHFKQTLKYGEHHSWTPKYNSHAVTDYLKSEKRIAIRIVSWSKYRDTYRIVRWVYCCSPSRNQHFGLTTKYTKYTIRKKSCDAGLFSDLFSKCWKYGILFHMFGNGIHIQRVMHENFCSCCGCWRIARPDIWPWYRFKSCTLSLCLLIAYLDLNMRNHNEPETETTYWPITHWLYSILRHGYLFQEKSCFMTCAVTVDKAYLFMEG